ncbi:MAG: ArsR/SmtB family transcription factor [Dehalococcoidia bacterium]
MEAAFRALADPSRRLLLDQLRERDGQTLGELCAALPEMTRFGVMKHLDVLEAAGLITTVKVGREKHHYLNPVPIQLIADRWISQFARPRAEALAGLKHTLEGPAMSKPVYVYSVFIRATPEQVWQGITDPAFTHRYFHETRITSTWEPGSEVHMWMDDGRDAMAGTILECDPPRRLSHTWRFMYDPELAKETPSRVTYEIQQLGPTCRLTVTHDQFEEENQTWAHISGGWAALLNSLKSLIETGEPLAFPDA